MSEDLTKNLQTQDEKLTLVLSTVQALAIRVDNFERTVSARLYDARPILQKVAADIAQLQSGQQRLEQGVLQLEQRFRPLEQNILHLGEGQRRLEDGLESLRSEVGAFRRSVDYRFLTLSGSVLKRYNDLEQRVTQLELNSNPPNSQT